MTLKKVVELIDGRMLTGDDSLRTTVSAGCGCDLMSDVLSFAKSGSLLLTGLNNLQVIRTAEMAEIKAICFVRGKTPTLEMTEMAREKGIALLETKLPLFESCGRLYQGGLVGCSIQID
jgi:predicted transcriptional regulator